MEKVLLIINYTGVVNTPSVNSFVCRCQPNQRMFFKLKYMPMCYVNIY